MLNKIRLVGTLATFSLLMTANAYAVVPGPYLGFQFGWGNVHQSGISLSDMVGLVNNIVSPDSFAIGPFSNSSTADGWAGRVFTGYEFDCHWAAEIGYTRFHIFESNASITAINNVTDELVSIATADSGRTYAFDLVGKWFVHYNTGFTFYGKLGAAYLWNRIETSQVTSIFASTSEDPVSFSKSNSHRKVYPTFGLGVAYDASSQVLGDLSWNHIQRVGGDRNFGNTDFFSIGVAYYFNC
jgi:opacity protein-like surface antigen